MSRGSIPPSNWGASAGGYRSGGGGILGGLFIATMLEAVTGTLEYLWPDRRLGKAFSLGVRDRDVEG